MTAVEKIGNCADDVELSGAMSIATVVGVSDEGDLIVNPDGTAAAVTAALLESCAHIRDESYVGRRVLVGAVEGSGSGLLVMGLLELGPDERDDVEVSNSEDVLMLEANREIRIKCGQGSITLKQDGSIVMRGRRLISRASEEQKIKGATVRIN